MFNFSNLCSNSSFLIINPNSQTFGQCFLDTCILIPSSFLFTIVNAYILGTTQSVSRQYSNTIISIIRFVAFQLLILSLIQIFNNYFWNYPEFSIADTTTLIIDLYGIAALALHLCNVMNKNIFTRYPIKLIIAIMVFTAGNIIQLLNRIYLEHNYKSLKFILKTSLVCSEVLYIVLVLFTLTRAFGLKNPYLVNSRCRNVHVQDTDKHMLIEDDDENETDKSEEDLADYFSYLTFEWLKPVMEKVYKQFMLKYRPLDEPNPIEQPDLLLQTNYMQNIASEYEEDSIMGLVSTNRNRLEEITLVKGLLQTFGVEFFSLGVLKLINDILNFSGPLLLNQLVQFVESKGESLREGCFYAACLFLTSLLGAIINIHFSNSMNKLTFRLRSVIITSIYKKAVTVKLNELSKYSIGQIVNYMSIDTDSIVNAFPSFHAFWSLPLQICIALYLLYTQIGISFLVGVAFIILLIPINKVLSDYIGKIQTKLMFFKDLRVKLMTEFLHGIRVIKFYSWEKYFLTRINDVRTKELSQLKAKKYLDAACVYFWACTPILISVTTFTTYVLIGNKLTPSKVFTSLALFNMLISPLNSFPWVINGLVQANVSLKRVQEFLGLANLNWLNFYSFNDFNVISICPGLSIDIKDSQMFWKKTPSNDLIDYVPKVVLDGINLKIKKGELIGIIGKVGCGKTSLLHTFMGELEKSTGKIKIDSAICAKGFAYVGQDCWIKAGTIKENILFGAPMNDAFYRKVIEACALTSDLNMFPKADETYVGENGITLSGGQKARLALARACYANNLDVYLLDDPLSAVDMTVGQHIYKQCVSELLEDKTRIICTHHYKHLMNADLVIVIEDGRIVKSGRGTEIIPGYMTKVSLVTALNPSASVKENEEKNDIVQGMPEKLIEQLKSLDSEKLKKQDEEEKEQGAISYQVYKYYCISIGICLTTLTLLSLLFMQGSRNLTDIWLSYWTEQHSSVNLTSSTLDKKFYDDDSEFFFIVYGSLCIANSVFTLARAFLFAYSGILAGKYIHECLIGSLSKANLKFFQNIPTGRILNRLSSDMYAIDDSLPFILNIFLANFFGLMGMLSVTCYSLPWFSLSLIPLSIVYYNIQSYYRWTSRELKRLSSISLSPIYTHFHETLTGLTTIRAFRQVKQFIDTNEIFLTDYIRASYVNLAASQWLNFRLQMISVAMITVVGFTAVFQHIYSTANASLIGLALSYVLSVTGMLNGLISSFTETEKEMVSVERAHQLEKVETENWDGVVNVDEDWPVCPTIEYDNVTLKYTEDGANALDGVSFSIKSGEKIGVCGRTGSGKSSILTALFRGAELNSGTIRICGIDISDLNLTDLRQRISIIPQDPFLFNGTLRENLDPTGAKQDHHLWTVLKKCRLEQKFNTVDTAGLDEKLEEKGKNLSSGEKQLICLARALLSDRKILCIDEATASVDFETDLFIQETIKREFKNTIVITIAHRIQTIFDSDRILAMNEGRVAEFDTAKNLLDNRESVFYNLVNNVEMK